MLSGYIFYQCLHPLGIELMTFALLAVRWKAGQKSYYNKMSTQKQILFYISF